MPPKEETMKIKFEELDEEIQDLGGEIRETHLLALAARDDASRVNIFRAHFSRVDSTFDKFTTKMLELKSLARQLNIALKEYDELKRTTSQCYYETLALGLPAPENINPADVSRRNSTNSANEVGRITLQPISMPHFDGEIANWPGFKDTFESLIHTNPQLADVQKFHYLRAALKGNALQAVSAISLSEAGYQQAWDALKARYDNKRLLATNLLVKIFEFSPITKPSVNALKEFSSVVIESANAFRNLEIADAGGFVLSTFALRLLDSRTRERFEQQQASKTNPNTFADFATFIQQQFLQIQSAALNSPSVNKPPAFNYHNTPRQSKHVFFASNSTPTNNPTCPICQNSHRIYDCDQLRRVEPQQRYERITSMNRCLNCLALGHSYRTCPSTSSCNKCQGRHHTLLHFNKPLPSNVKKQQIEKSKPPAPSKPAYWKNKSTEASPSNDDLPPNQKACGSGKVLSSSAGGLNILLGTARARITDYAGNFHSIRMVIDSGSQRSFITEAFAKRLGLRTTKNPQKLVGFAESSIAGGKLQLQCEITSKNPSFLPIKANPVIINQISGPMPSCVVPVHIKNYFEHHNLADPSFCEPGPIDFLLGADLFGKIMLNETLSTPHGFPNAFKTIFGYVIMGPVPHHDGASNAVSLLACDMETNNTEPIESLMEKFWTAEEVSIAPKMNPEDMQAEEHFATTQSRDSSGRYTVRLPFKTSQVALGPSKYMAQHRLYKLEDKLRRDSVLQTEYNRILHEYLSKEYMSPAPKPGLYYLPHHCVLKDSTSTKVRIVFDASAPTSFGSLNSKLLTGPKLQNDIRDVMLSFRIHPIAMTADICQMYLQITVDQADRPYQHLLYRFSPADSVEEYQLNRLSFGLSCAPFLAIRVLKQLVTDEGCAFLLASEALSNHAYIDDILTGAENLEAALKLKSELIELLKKGGFELKKWTSNCKDLLADLPDELLEQTVSFSNLEDSVVKILGMQWEPSPDCLSCKIQPTTELCTKRGIMSSIARIYDPLGYLAPVVFKAKTILQNLWKIKLDWDETTPEPVTSQWKKWLNDLPSLAAVRIPRCLFSGSSRTATLIGFADASTLGYAAVFYLRIKNDKGQFDTHLLISKTKLAPLKTLTVPRLELCAALLLAQLFKFLHNFLSQIEVNAVFLFSDSSVVLSWLRTPLYRLKTFVANRVASVLEVSSPSMWYHVASEDNAADLASRGLDPSQLSNQLLWWHGPQWLRLPVENWPLKKVNEPRNTDELPEMKDIVLLQPAVAINFLEEQFQRFSSYTRLTKVFSYVYRFAHNTRAKIEERKSGALLLAEIRETTAKLHKLIQKQYFNEERIKQIKSLTPFLDSAGVLRVGGRLTNAPLTYDAKRPVLLPHSSHFVKLLVDHLHHTHLHAGNQLLHSIIRRHYWILSSRRLVRNRIHQCLRCHRLRTKTMTPIMGDLPATRFEQGRPFLNVGIDFAGPFALRESSRRKAAVGKAYVALFVCFSTKALHIEIVSSLSTDAFLASFDRFIARRGLPSKVFTDNGTNFVGANNRLKEVYIWWRLNETKDKITSHLHEKAIEWSFIPPAAPHFGGLWEAGVKSFKHHFVRVTNQQALTFEELSTISHRIEAMLNSRPLHPLSPSPEDYDFLTPGHFLVGGSLVAPPEYNYTDVPSNRLNRWQFLSKCVRDIWTKWRCDYLTHLNQRVKWNKPQRNLGIGTLVLLKNNDSPPLHWPAGRIIEEYPGDDQVVRVVKIRTAKGEYVRSVTRLAPLLPEED